MANNPGYTDEVPQSEVTGQGPFDWRVIQARADFNKRNLQRNECYPGVSKENLGILRGEYLLARRHCQNTLVKNVSVFSSLNGEWWGRHKGMGILKRHYEPIGMAKVDHHYNTESRDYQNDNFVSWIASGSCKLNRNTGSQIIPAGSLVYLDFPSTPLRNIRESKALTKQDVRSPNNPGAGMPNGKFVLVTKPFDPKDFSAQLETYALLFNRSKGGPQRGISDLKFVDSYLKKDTLTSAQSASAALFYGIFGIWAAVHDVLKSKNLHNTPAKTVLENIGIFSRDKSDDAKACVKNVMLQHYGVGYAQIQKKFQEDHPAAFKDGKLMTLDEKSTIETQYAYLHMDALSNIFGAIGEAAAEENRWIAGKCLEDSAPGKGLKLNIGNWSRPSTF